MIRRKHYSYFRSGRSCHTHHFTCTTGLQKQTALLQRIAFCDNPGHKPPVHAIPQLSNQNHHTPQVLSVKEKHKIKKSGWLVKTHRGFADALVLELARRGRVYHHLLPDHGSQVRSLGHGLGNVEGRSVCWALIGFGGVHHAGGKRKSTMTTRKEYCTARAQGNGSDVQVSVLLFGSILFELTTFLRGS